MSKSLLNMQQKLSSLDGPEWDSSDSEGEAPASKSKTGKKGMPAGDVVDLNSKKKNSKKSKKAAVVAAPASCVIYLGHLPPNFEESEIQGFLAQFGDVEGVRVSRSKKTGNSKGFAFVKFADADVAKIVADTMSGYFLLERRLVSHVLPLEQVREDMFKGKFRKVDWREEHAKKVNKARTAEEVTSLSVRQSTRLNARLEKLKALGIDVGSLEEVRGVKPVKRAREEEKKVKEVGSVKKKKKAGTPKKTKQ